jgi:hypothetical protein
MNAAIIGLSSSVITIFLFVLLKRFDKKIIYGLVLAAIGFLYVGYTWTDVTAVIMNIVQAIFFLMLAYFGIMRNLYFLIAGYFMHGVWDIIYSQLANASLLPPHYDLFCSTYDFVVGVYLLILKYQMNHKVQLPAKM